MRYQRVLYTDEFTPELKSKLRIVSYNKRRSLKGNVYYVSFALDADIKYADRACKRLRNVTLKPFQSRDYRKTQYKDRLNTFSQRRTVVLSPIPLKSLSTTVTFLSDCPSTSITSESGSVRRANETLEEHAMRVLGPSIATPRTIIPVPTLHPSNLVSSSLAVRLLESRVFFFKYKGQGTIY
jgi:hypothetical protein